MHGRVNNVRHRKFLPGCHQGKRLLVAQYSCSCTARHVPGLCAVCTVGHSYMECALLSEPFAPKRNSASSQPPRVSLAPALDCPAVTSSTFVTFESIASEPRHFLKLISLQQVI